MGLDTFTIRPASIADASALPAIERSAALLYGEFGNSKVLQEPPVIDQITHTRWMRDGRYLVAEQGMGRRVGFLAALCCGAGKVAIMALSVRRAYQRRGLGRALLFRSLTEAGKDGIAEVWCEVDTSLPWIAPLSASAGFEAVGAGDIPASVKRIAGEHRLPVTCADRWQNWQICRPGSRALKS